MFAVPRKDKQIFLNSREVQEDQEKFEANYIYKV